MIILNNYPQTEEFFFKKIELEMLDYDKDLDLIIILTENVPALVTIKKLFNF